MPRFFPPSDVSSAPKSSPRRKRNNEYGLTAQAPFQRHRLAGLLKGAWALHHSVRLVDALYIELAEQLDASIVTTDLGIASAAPSADHIELH